MRGDLRPVFEASVDVIALMRRGIDPAGVDQVPKQTPRGRGTVTFAVERGMARVSVETARTPAQRTRGLMHRASLAADAGMLFVFPRLDRHAFWMKNTRIPLDMIFLDDDWRVVGVIEDVEPMTTASRDVGSRTIKPSSPCSSVRPRPTPSAAR